VSAAVREQALGAVRDWLAAQHDLAPEAVAPDAWVVVLEGEHKKTIPVHLSVGERHTAVQSFFVRAPDENEAGLYDYLLRRNLKSYVLRFALTDDGDVLLVGLVPNGCVNATELDLVFGQLLAVADEAFASALRLGFASYIEREQAWRAKVGAPRNPIT
jgi:hypothetical protein